MLLCADVSITGLLGATPLILDLAILAELLARVQYRAACKVDFPPLYSVLSLP